MFQKQKSLATELFEDRFLRPFCIGPSRLRFFQIVARTLKNQLRTRILFGQIKIDAAEKERTTEPRQVNYVPVPFQRSVNNFYKFLEG